MLKEYSYTIEQIYTDNRLEYKGNEHHAFGKPCLDNKIEQIFTKVKCQRINGKAERVIKTIMGM